MLRTALLLAVFPFFSGQALAAGFEGGYFGVNLGGFMATTDTDHSIYKPFVGGAPNGPITQAATLDAVSSLNASPDQSSLLGGIHGGYNWRLGSFVVGVEADLNYWGYSASATGESTRAIPSLAGFRTVRSTNTAEATYLFTLRPRFGYALSERSLIHASIGLAYADLEYTNSSQIFPLTIAPGTVNYSSSASTNLGTIFGVGFEHAASDRMTLRVDYQYLAFDRATSTGVANPDIGDLTQSAVTVGYETKVHVLRLGVNWRF